MKVRLHSEKDIIIAELFTNYVKSKRAVSKIIENKYTKHASEMLWKTLWKVWKSTRYSGETHVSH